MTLGILGEFIDLYAEQINFTYKKRPYYKTGFGGFISFLVFGFLIAYFAILILEMVLRRYPNIISKTFITDIPPTVDILTEEEYNRLFVGNSFSEETVLWQTSFGVRSSTGKLVNIDDSMIVLTLNELQISEGNLSSRKLRYKKCNNFGGVSEELFNNLQLEDTYCINDSYRLSGAPGKEGSSWVEARFSLCDYQYNALCQNVTYITDFVNEAQLELYYQNRVFNTSSHDELIPESVEQFYWDLLPSFTKIVSLEVGYDALKSFNSYLPDFFESRYNLSSALVLRYTQMDLMDLNSERDLIVINFVSSRIKIEYSRKYKDLLLQLAMVGGISSIIVSIGFLFSYLFARFRFEESMINNFYNLIDPKRNKEIFKTFDEFLHDHYNFLFNKFLKYVHSGKKPHLSSALTIKNIEIKLRTEEDMLDPDSISLNEKLDNSQEKLKEKEKIYQVDDDEGLMRDETKFNALKKYFTLKRIECIFGVSYEQRLKKFKELEEIHNYKAENLISKNIDFFKFVFCDENEQLQEKHEEYYLHSAVYEIFKFECNDKINFTTSEMFFRLFCKCCINKNRNKNNKIKYTATNKTDNASTTKNNDIDPKEEEKSRLFLKYEIFDAAQRKMDVDFDLVSILQTVDDFEKFKHIYFDDAQLDIFNSVANPVIKLTNNKEKIFSVNYKHDNKDIKALNNFIHVLSHITEKDEMTMIEKKLLAKMGLDAETIKKFSKEIERKRATTIHSRNHSKSENKKKQNIINEPVEEVKDSETMYNGSNKVASEPNLNYENKIDKCDKSGEK